MVRLGMADRVLGQYLRGGLLVAALLTIAGCDENGKFSLGGGAGPATDAATPSQSTELVQTDIEAPEVFQLTAQGLWDGRPSLGGVWVAHPDVTDPERVIIRNQANGQFVIGALFRRERENPGPALQVSSDAAEALGMLAGAPSELNVTALRREEATAPAEAAPVADFGTADAIAATPLDPIAGAAAAIDAAEAPIVAPDSDPAPAPDPAPPGEIMSTALDGTPLPPATTAPEAAIPLVNAGSGASALERPYIHIGIFSIEANADAASAQMSDLGLTARVVAQQSQGRDFWSVIVGPAATEADRAAALDKVKAAGFADAYFARN